MALQGVVIDERTLRRGSEAQREEWDAIIRALLSKAEALFEGEMTAGEQEFGWDGTDRLGRPAP